MFLKEVSFGKVDVTIPSLVRVRVNSRQAAEWLMSNTGNRRIRNALVEYLKKQIKSGEWQDDHPQPIVFSAGGRLLDGQHRLKAISESELSNGDSVFIRVETGAQERVREYLDTGVSRTLEDRVALFDDPQLNRFAAQLVAVDNEIYGKNKCGKPTPEDAREFCAIHGRAIEAVFKMHKRERGTGMITVAMAAMQYHERSTDKAEEFYTDLFIPAGRVQQAQMLRDFLSKCQSSSAGRSSRLEFYQKSVGCMKAHMEGRTVKKVIRSSSWEA